MERLRYGVRCAAAAFLLSLASAIVCADIPAGERQVLLEIYRDTHGDNWKDNTNWNDEAGTECGWSGVVCNQQEHVVKIVLDMNGLSGTLPASIGQLTYLEGLSVEGNELTGPIPNLNGLKNLEFFDVSSNQLTGKLPDLSGLVKLTSFNANHNDLSGPLPRLAGLVYLEFFDVSENHLSGSIPSLEGLTHLKAFSLMDNELTGMIPNLNGLPLLHDLYLSNNRLSGPIPELRGLGELRYLITGNNQLTGSIPDLSEVSNLQEFSVAHNQLSGDLPGPPARAVAASLCPNRLNHPSADARIDAAWNKLTKDKPWWRGCNQSK